MDQCGVYKEGIYSIPSIEFIHQVSIRLEEFKWLFFNLKNSIQFNAKSSLSLALIADIALLLKSAISKVNLN